MVLFRNNYSQRPRRSLTIFYPYDALEQQFVIEPGLRRSRDSFRDDQGRKVKVVDFFESTALFAKDRFGVFHLINVLRPEQHIKLIDTRTDDWRWGELWRRSIE